MGEDSKHKVSPIKNFFGGGVGGVTTVLVGHPFDTIKVTSTPFAQQVNLLLILYLKHSPGPSPNHAKSRPW